MFTYKKAGFNTLNEMFDSMLDKQAKDDHKSFVKMSSLLTFNDKLAFIDYSKGHKVFAGAMKDMLSECCGKFSVSQNYANLIMNALTLAGYYTEVKDSLDCNYPQFDFSDNMLIEGTVHLFDHKVCLKAVDATGKLYEKSITFYTDKDLVESVNHFQKDIQETFNKKEDVSMDALLQNPEFMASIGAEDCLVKKQADIKDAVMALSEFYHVDPKDVSTQDGKNYKVINNPNEIQISDKKIDNMVGYNESEYRIDNNNSKFIYEKSETPKTEVKEEVKIEDKASQVICFYKKADIDQYNFKDLTPEEIKNFINKIETEEGLNYFDLDIEELDLSDFTIIFYSDKVGEDYIIKGKLDIDYSGWVDYTPATLEQPDEGGYYENVSLNDISINEVNGTKYNHNIPLDSALGKMLKSFTVDDDNFYNEYIAKRGSSNGILTKKASVEELKTAIDEYDLTAISNQKDIINEPIDDKPCVSYALEKYASDEKKGLEIIKKLVEAGAVILEEDITKAEEKGYSQGTIYKLKELLPSKYEQEFAKGYDAIQ